jgi:hypothetical protein
VSSWDGLLLGQSLSRLHSLAPARANDLRRLTRSTTKLASVVFNAAGEGKDDSGRPVGEPPGQIDARASGDMVEPRGQARIREGNSHARPTRVEAGNAGVEDAHARGIVPIVRPDPRVVQESGYERSPNARVCAWRRRCACIRECSRRAAAVRRRAVGGRRFSQTARSSVDWIEIVD